jgi:hypothetical protein
MSNAAAAVGGPGAAAAAAGAPVAFMALRQPIQANINPYFASKFDNLHMNIINETHPRFQEFLADRNPKMRLTFDVMETGAHTVMEITGDRRDTRTEMPLVAAIIRSGLKQGTVTHEIYSVSTSHEYKSLLDLERSRDPQIKPPSIAHELLRYILLFHGNFNLTNGIITQGVTPETQPVLYWLGVRTDGDDRQGLNRLLKLYQDAGFFFPNLIFMAQNPQVHHSYVNNRNNTPLGGRVIPFKFISGYWSSSIKEFTEMYGQALFNVDNASASLIGTQKNYALLQTERIEHSGFLNIGDTNMAEREPENPDFVARAAATYRIVAHGGVQGSYTFEDQVRYHNAAPCGTFFQDPTKNPFRRFQFHTHPLQCHAETLLARGFPSQPDIQCLFWKNCDMNVGGLMVFSREGSWLIRMNPYLLFLKFEHPDRYESYRPAIEAYLEILTNNPKEFGLYTSTRTYTGEEIAAKTNTITKILAMNTPSENDLAQAEKFIRLVNSRYLLPFRVDGMEMAPFSVQFIQRNQAGYRFVYTIKKI